MITLIFIVLLYTVVSQNINVENINIIITDKDSLMNKIFSSVGIQYFAPYQTNYKTLPNTNTDKMKLLYIDKSVILKNYLETYDFLINYPEQTMRKKFVDYVNTYTAGATKIMVLTNYINEYAYTVGAHHIRIINDIGLSFMISLISYQNKCRIGEYSKVNIQEGESYISCKIYNDNYYAYYDIAKRGPNNYNSYEHNYILNTKYGDIIFINETLYT